MTRVTLKNIILCSADQQKSVRDIRNQPSIRKSMYTEHEIGLDEHLSWLESLKDDKKQIIFVVLINDIVSGVVSVNALDRLHKKSDWAFYLSEDARGGLGAALEYHFLDFVFDGLGLEKLNCEVIETNEAVINRHKKFGFHEEGFRRSNIEKDGKRIGVSFLGITKEDWQHAKNDVRARYEDVMNNFDVTIEYQDG